MKCDIKIMGSPKRIDNIEKMKNKLGLTSNDVFLDDRPNGGDAMYTARKAWALPMDADVTHRCVLQDDLAICDGFNDALQRIVSAHPNNIICLYNPMKPKDYNTKSPYIRNDGGDLWGQAIVIPIEHIFQMFAWVDSINPHYPHDDVAVAEYARVHKIPVLITRFSLVQHLCPNASLLKYNDRRKVSKVFVDDLGIDASIIDWESDEPMIMMNRKCFMRVS